MASATPRPRSQPRQAAPQRRRRAAGALTVVAVPRSEPAEWVVVPDARHAQAVARRCRRMVTQRALLAAGVAMVPVPGLDWATDVGLLAQLLPEINAAFGLSAEQIERLSPDRRVIVYKTVRAAGGLVIGRVVTQQVVMGLLKVVGIRLTAQQAAKYVPIAGQALSAVLAFSALKAVCELHIRQCVAICEQLDLPASEAAERIA